MISLHCRSAYSFLSSTITFADYFQYAQVNGLQALALTDRDNLYGGYEFYKACLAAKVKPVIGVEFTLLLASAKTVTVLVYAKSEQGYQRLLQMVTKANTQAQVPRPGLTFAQLLAFINQELIVVFSAYHSWFEACNNETTAQQLYSQVASKTTTYVGISQYQPQLTAALKKIFKPEQLIPCDPVFYLHAQDHQAWTALKAIKNQTILTKAELKPTVGPFHYQLESALKAAYDPAIYANLANLINQIDLKFTPTVFKAHLLKYPCPNHQPSSDFLVDLCRQQLSLKFNQKELISSDLEAYKQRLKKELAIIIKMGFADYFLVVWDYVQFAKGQGIFVGPGRGSAASSLVAFLIGITEVDPLKYNLLFERFLNPERISMPDIDIDFQDDRRQEVIEYLLGKYGQDHVAHISTFQTMGMRMAIRDVGRVLHLNLAEVDLIAKAVPNQYNENLDLAFKYAPALWQWKVKQPLLFKIVSQIIGLPRQTSVHAAGIILSQQPLSTIVPLQKSYDQVWQSQYPMTYLEELGLLKMDLLGLRNLTLLNSMIKLIAKTTNQQINLNKLPLNDRKTYALIAQGDTTGIFQLESTGMRQVLVDLKASQFEDIVATTALFRPGPADNIPHYVARKFHREPVNYIVPALEPILAPTYGIVVYQEQVMLIAQTIADYSLGEADLLRRAMSKKDPTIMANQKAKFMHQAQKKGYQIKAIAEIWAFIEKFAAYGFNRSHAVAYSLISYWLAYLKANFSSQFLACLLTSVIGNDLKTAEYLQQARQYHLKVKPPTVNCPYSQYTVINGEIIASLLIIKQIGNRFFQQLKQEFKDHGPFKSIFDFVIRMTKAGLNQRLLTMLIKAGALDEFNSNRQQLLVNVDDLIDYGLKVSQLFDPSALPQLKLKPAEPDLLLNSQGEKEALGFYWNYHPLKLAARQLKSHQFVPISTVKTLINQTRAFLVIIDRIKIIKTKNGALMCFLRVSDENQNQIDVTVFPSLYQNLSAQIAVNQIIVLTAKIEAYQQKSQLVAQQIKIIHLKTN